MRFATKSIRQYPTHHRYVGTLPWEIKNSKFSADIQQMWKKMQTNCIFIASNYIIHPKILIFLVFKIASCFPHWLQVTFFMTLFFYLFTFAINLWHHKFVTVDITAVFVNNQHGIQRQGQDFDKTHKYAKHTQLHAYRN